MEYRFKPTDYVIRVNGKLKYRILKLVKHPSKKADEPNNKVYECVSTAGTVHYFTDEELEAAK